MKAWADAISRVASIATPRAGISMFGGVFMNSEAVWATNGTCFLWERIEGLPDCAVPAVSLASALKNVGDVFEIGLDGQTLKVEGGGKSYSIPTFRYDGAPPIPQRGDKEILVPEVAHEDWTWVASACERDISRPVLEYVAVYSDGIAATNTHVLLMVGGLAGDPFLLHADIAKHIQSGVAYEGANGYWQEAGSRGAFVQKVAAEPLAVGRVIPPADSLKGFSAEEWRLAIDSLVGFVDEYCRVSFQGREGLIKADSAQAEISPVDILDFRANYRYMKTATRGMDQIQVTNATRPVLFHGDEERRAVVMPFWGGS